MRKGRKKRARGATVTDLTLTSVSADELRRRAAEGDCAAIAEQARREGWPEPVEVEFDDGPDCPACGTRGPHYCTGGQAQSGGYVGKRAAA